MTDQPQYDAQGVLIEPPAVPSDPQPPVGPAPSAGDVAPVAEPALRNPKSRRVRNGRIARLPMHLRDSVSWMLYRGCTHDFIAKDLNDDGYPEITRQNITSWAKRGYQDWLKAHETLNSFSIKTKLHDEFPRYVGRDSRKLNNINNFLLAARMNQVLEHLDPKELARLVAADPDVFFRFIKEEFNRQKEERSLDYQAEDRKNATRRRAEFAQKVKLWTMDDDEREKVIAKMKADDEKTLQQLNAAGQNS